VPEEAPFLTPEPLMPVMDCAWLMIDNPNANAILKNLFKFIDDMVYSPTMAWCKVK
jgi:hypothetical protein